MKILRTSVPLKNVAYYIMGMEKCKRIADIFSRNFRSRRQDAVPRYRERDTSFSRQVSRSVRSVQ